MNRDLEIALARDSDTPEILSLIRTSLGEGEVPRESAYWAWKHLDNPFGGSPVVIARSDDQLVGLRAFMRWTWTAGGTAYPAVRAVDTATHPAWRGRGVFSRLTNLLVERMQESGVAFIFNTPNESSRPGYLKMGWSSVGRVSLWVRPLPFGRSMGTAAGGEASVAALQSGGRSLREAWTLPGLADFLNAIQADGKRFRTPLSIEYLRWRYEEVPGIHYFAAGDVEDDNSALFVWRLKSRGRFVELRLCESFVGPGKGAVRQAGRTLRALLAAGRADFASAMATWGSPQQRTLLRSGFIPAPRCGPVLTVRPLNIGRKDPDPRRRGAWAASIGDLELF